MQVPRLRPSSPFKVNALVRPLVEYLGLHEEEAVLLQVTRPKSFAPEVRNCHLNVWCQLAFNGGDRQHGWVLAQDLKHKFAEAIFHTVWRAPGGNLIDVTPREDGEKNVLFLPDHERATELASHEGSPAINTFDNVRIQDGALVTPLQRIQVVMQSGFAQRHGLWPW
jgi:hypothetical protein